jgi:tetratricopeptide (TPR) repeat protein
MKISQNTSIASWMRGAATILAAVLVSACSTPGTTRRAQMETRNEGGFTISERVRVSGSARSSFDKAMRMMEEQEYEAAIELLRKVTTAAPEVVAPHIDLGIAYGHVGELENAEASFAGALALNPRHPVAHNELGILYRRMGRFAEARASYEQALDRYPDFHFARRNLAILCDVYLSDMSCAIENYELYSRAVPDDEEAVMWIADLRNRSGQ